MRLAGQEQFAHQSGGGVAEAQCVPDLMPKYGDQIHLVPTPARSIVVHQDAVAIGNGQQLAGQVRNGDADVACVQSHSFPILAGHVETCRQR